MEECIAEGNSDEGLLECVTSSLSRNDELLALGIDFVFLMFSTALVFFMQAGFAMLCAGSVRRKNVQNSMLKNLLDACGAAIGFWTFGYAFAYSPYLPGDGGTSFIGNQHFALNDLEPTEYSFWLFQFAFAATSATIVAGTLAERCQMIAYLCYSLVLTGLVYPIVVRAIWSQYGFLNFRNGQLFGEERQVGMIDFAGGGVVHVTGGITALLATKILGPRKGRFYDYRGRKLETPAPFPGHSAALQVLGTFILWLGWYGFNCGSIVTVSKGTSTTSNALIASLTAVNTTLAASGACVSALFTKLYRTERRSGEATFNLVTALNGTLAGLVSITAGCAIIEPWAALVTGLIAGWIYLYVSDWLIKHCLDDAVDAIPVHFANGAWGVISVGLFAAPKHMIDLYENDLNVGWFYEWGRGSGNASLLAAQIVGLLFILTWTVGAMAPFFILLNYLGWFRADSLEEVVGLDISYHGGAVYNSDSEKVRPEYLQAYEKRKRDKKNLSSHSGAESYHSNSWHYEPRTAPVSQESGINVPMHQSITSDHPVLSILKEQKQSNIPLDVERNIQAYNVKELQTQEEIAAILGPNIPRNVSLKPFEDFVPVNIGMQPEYEDSGAIPIHIPSAPQHPVLGILKGQRTERVNSEQEISDAQDNDPPHMQKSSEPIIHPHEERIDLNTAHNPVLSILKDQ